ncbi:MAG: UDP-N-acetylmuramoyl-tripeptide--D-alanyl-D-alanine ligase, partial [Flavobacteriales bacterium]|nr:UDP-N-acetylmuramoyl-tripeptide--D-alanyl-D-alanine ligase [Flavobacteriales bacterium]
RKLIPNSIFWALKGENFDGNTFVHDALNFGCAYAVTDRSEYRETDPRILVVEDTLDALQQTANYARSQMAAVVIGITGSNGKTTTKELIYRVLSKRFRAYATPGNFNNHIGLPLTILSTPADTEFLLLEMGDNHPGEIAALCAIALPEYGFITNVGKDHIEGFGSFAANKLAKKELYDFLAATGGKAFVPVADKDLVSMASAIENVVQIGSDDALVLVPSDSPFLKYADPEGMEHITLISGDYNLPNLQAAFSIGRYFGVSPVDIHQAVCSYQPQNLRSQILESPTITVFLDTYNANPSSMLLALENFYSKNHRPHKFFVIGDMLELGEESTKEHRDIVDWVTRRNIEGLFVGAEFEKVLGEGHPRHCTNAAEAAEKLGGLSLSAHQILVKGSRGIRLEKVLPALGFTVG